MAVTIRVVPVTLVSVTLVLPFKVLVLKSVEVVVMVGGVDVLVEVVVFGDLLARLLQKGVSFGLFCIKLTRSLIEPQSGAAARGRFWGTAAAKARMARKRPGRRAMVRKARPDYLSWRPSASRFQGRVQTKESRNRTEIDGETAYLCTTDTT